MKLRQGFAYVINPPEKPRVAFGSCIEREVLPLRGPGLSPFMRRQLGDVFLSPGPVARVDERNHMEIKYPSKLGYSAFASKLSRLPLTQTSKYPCVGTYELQRKEKQRKAFKPFNSGSLRTEISKFLTPAPNTYRPLRRPQLRLNTAFGTQRKISPTVQIICSRFNTAKCHKCHQTPRGDYWRNFEKNLDLCRPCRNKIHHEITSCSVTELLRGQLQHYLKDYRLVRYCGFLHDHNGTTAATQLIPTKTLKFKITKENYLSFYM